MSVVNTVDVFLGYNFKRDAKEGYILAIDSESGSLQRIEKKKVSLAESIFRKYDTSLKSISAVITKALSEIEVDTLESQQRLRLEKQTARFQRKAKQKEVVFKNPYIRKLVVEVNYPYFTVDSEIVLDKMLFEVEYTPLTLCKKVWTAILEKEPSAKAWKTDDCASNIFRASRNKRLFKKIKNSEPKLTLTFTSYDMKTFQEELAKKSYQLGYKKGFRDGKNARRKEL